MPIGDPYATLSDLKSRLSITDAVDDTKLTAALAAASKWIEKYCRRQFNDAGTISPRWFDPLSFRSCLVDDFSTSAGLIVATDADRDGTAEVTWGSSDYELRPLNGIQNGSPGWPYWRLNVTDSSANLFPAAHRASVQVTARWGWAAVPDPVHDACLALAEQVFKMKDAPYGVAGFGEFGVVRVRANPLITMMLDEYRRDAVRVA